MANKSLEEKKEQGLGSVLTASSPSGLKLIEVPLETIKTNPHQPRKSFENNKIDLLAQSISRDGFLQPLVVLPASEQGFYFLLAGERRLRAAKRLGLQKVPVVIKSFEAEDSMRIALVENLQRRDLNVIEEAVAYKELIDEHDYTHEQCGKELGIDRTKITNLLRLLSLPEFAQASLVKEEITMGHARALLSLKEIPEMMNEVRKIIIEKGLSVRQTENLCRKLSKQTEQGRFKKASEEVINPNIEYLVDGLRQKLKTKVKLSGSSVRGKIEISYFSAAEFERLLGFFGC